ncbi:hypothetical protein A3860_18495 [Niastella vici]|uniref:Uncharacterized protein n=1 Tax=Niastella vici TaxID=1703345 RepID=A0A1V9G281_9BACT|nr:hypothetical protein [Niastella vici]OQP64749.1 hypothetical protein A3860_18495 [Niastella vici]
MKNESLQLSDIEVRMLEEVFQIFSKYSEKTRNFGIQLIHSHFPLQEDEILYETHDKISRVMEVKPVKIGSVSNNSLATAWDQTAKGHIRVAMFCCDSGGDD